MTGSNPFRSYAPPVLQILREGPKSAWRSATRSRIQPTISLTLGTEGVGLVHAEKRAIPSLSFGSSVLEEALLSRQFVRAGEHRRSQQETAVNKM